MTELIAVDAAAPDPAVIARAAACLLGGGLVAFPTETVYGLGVHALDAHAVRRLFAAKGRPASDPLIVHVGSLDAAAPLVTGIPPDAGRLAARFWPGPLTLVLPRSARVPDEVTAAGPTVALRAPLHPVARALLAKAGVPIAAPSANLFSRPSPTRATHVMDDLDGRIDLVLDAGPTEVGVESTVLDLTASPPVILRPGAITADMLRAVVPGVRVAPTPAALSPSPSMPSPGLLERHYSPRTPMTLYEGADSSRVIDRLLDDARRARALGHRVGILCAAEDRRRLRVDEAGVVVVELGSAADPGSIAACLYGALREMDASGVDVILAQGFPSSEGLGVAIQDRLRRAAAGRIVRVGERSSDDGVIGSDGPAPSARRTGRAG